ncbi:MAG: hypothetical protein L0G87_00500 [Renibacterium salmoninarum]|nr:hypothetical protein [Renibacterium salmoninarum]
MNNLIFQQGGINPERIQPFASGDALDLTNTQSKYLTDRQAKFEGDRVVTVREAYAADASNADGSKVSNGGVNMTACQDDSQVKTLWPDGTSSGRSTPRSVITIETIFNPASGTWLVNTFKGTGSGTVIQC